MISAAGLRPIAYSLLLADDASAATGNRGGCRQRQALGAALVPGLPCGDGGAAGFDRRRAAIRLHCGTARSRRRQDRGFSARSAPENAEHVVDPDRGRRSRGLYRHRGTGSSLNGSPKGDGWRPITSAPFDQDLELSVIEDNEVHALLFPCRRTARGWANASANRRFRCGLPIGARGRTRGIDTKSRSRRAERCKLCKVQLEECCSKPQTNHRRRRRCAWRI